jgi:hypothetical protein
MVEESNAAIIENKDFNNINYKYQTPLGKR